MEKEVLLKLLVPPRIEGASPSLKTYLIDNPQDSYPLQSLLAHPAIPQLVQVQGMIDHDEKRHIYCTITIFPNDLNHGQEKTGSEAQKSNILAPT